MELYRVGAEITSTNVARGQARSSGSVLQPALSFDVCTKARILPGLSPACECKKHAGWGSRHYTIAFDEISTCDNCSSRQRSAA